MQSVRPPSKWLVAALMGALTPFALGSCDARDGTGPTDEVTPSSADRTTIWVPVHETYPGEDTLPPTPAVMIATPSSVAAGSTVALTYDDPIDGTRGAYFVIKDAAGNRLAALWSDRFTEMGAGWTSDIEHMEILDYPVLDAGPDMIIVPDILEPGDYTVCTLNAPTELCTTLTVTAS